MYPKTPLIEKCLPRQILNRHTLSVENEQQLDQILTRKLSAYGFNVNVGRFCCSDGSVPEYLWSYEVGPSNDGGKTNQCNINYILNEKQINGD